MVCCVDAAMLFSNLLLLLFVCNMQRLKEKKCYGADDVLADDEIDGRWNFSVEEKLLSAKFSDVPKFYIELNGSGAFVSIVIEPIYREICIRYTHFRPKVAHRRNMYNPHEQNCVKFTGMLTIEIEQLKQAKLCYFRWYLLTDCINVMV